MRLSYTEGGQNTAREEKFRRIIRVRWKGFSADLSYGAAIREKLNQTDSEKFISKILPAQAVHTRLTTERSVGNLLVTFESLSFMIKGCFPNPNSFSSTAD